MNLQSHLTTLVTVTLAGAALPASAAVDFVKDIQPILEFNCVSCHRDGEAKGGLRLDNFEKASTTGDSGPGIVPGKPDKSPVYTTTILAATDEDVMPPKKKGPPLPKETTDLLKKWIEEGASWPKDIKLVARKKEVAPKKDETALVKEIYARIAANSPALTEKEMKAYASTIPGTEVNFEMLPIPSGKFKMGSPASEDGRQDDEGPQRQVEIAPFWMGKCEITWNEFELFMYPTEERRIRATHKVDDAINELTDGSTRPTQPYVEMSFGMGKDGFPAISMTQHAANKYCEWLSAKTGQFYRLPTEAEWEYAARAGTETPYFWGNDASKADEFCWWGNNSDGKYQKVGKKKPNPWGLHDILGNVIEWTIDGYDEKSYATAGNVNPWVKASKPYPHAARGGSWADETADKLRAAARRASDADWKIQDPQFPKSVWYHTDAQFLGFRIVRPLTTPTAEEMQKYWNSGVEKD